MDSTAGLGALERRVECGGGGRGIFPLLGVERGVLGRVARGRIAVLTDLLCSGIVCFVLALFLKFNVSCCLVQLLPPELYVPLNCNPFSFYVACFSKLLPFLTP